MSKVETMIADLWSASEIAAACGLTKGQVLGWAWRRGLRLASVPRPQVVRITEIDHGIIEGMLAGGEPVARIARVLRLSEDIIRREIKTTASLRAAHRIARRGRQDHSVTKSAHSAQEDCPF